MNNTDLCTALASTEFDAIHTSPLILAAKELHESIAATHAFCVATEPRWASLYDQVSRSSSSVYLNLHEANGRLRGHWLNSMLISRGEAYETAAGLSIGIPQWRELLPLAKQIIQGINKEIREANFC